MLVVKSKVKSVKFIPGEKYGKLTFIRTITPNFAEKTTETVYSHLFQCVCGREYWGNPSYLRTKIGKGKTLSCGCDSPLPREKLFQVRRKGEKLIFFFSINTKGWKREQLEAVSIIFKWFIHKSGLPLDFLYQKRQGLHDLCVIFSKNHLAFLQLISLTGAKTSGGAR